MLTIKHVMGLPQIPGQRVLVGIKFCHGKDLPNIVVFVVTHPAHSSEQLGMAKWLLWADNRGRCQSTNIDRYFRFVQNDGWF